MANREQHKSCEKKKPKKGKEAKKPGSGQGFSSQAGFAQQGSTPDQRQKGKK